jgi:hypothetical protein
MGDSISRGLPTPSSARTEPREPKVEEMGAESVDKVQQGQEPVRWVLETKLQGLLAPQHFSA